MNDLQNSYSELLQAMKTLILQDYDPKEWVASDAETVAYFRQFISHSRQPSPSTQRKQPEVISRPEPIKSPPSPAPVSTPPATKITQDPIKEKPPEFKQIQQPPAAKTAPKVMATHDFKREPIEKIHTLPLGDVKQKVAELFPKWKIVDQIPSDEEAIRYTKQWEKVNEVYFVSDNNNPQERVLIGKIADAISAKYCPAKLIEVNASVKIPECALLVVTERMRKSIPEGYTSPVIVMEEHDKYGQQPELKKVLWKNICEILQKL